MFTPRIFSILFSKSPSLCPLSALLVIVSLPVARTSSLVMGFWAPPSRSPSAFRLAMELLVRSSSRDIAVLTFILRNSCITSTSLSFRATTSNSTSLSAAPFRVKIFDTSFVRNSRGLFVDSTITS